MRKKYPDASTDYPSWNCSDDRTLLHNWALTKSPEEEVTKNASEKFERLQKGLEQTRTLTGSERTLAHDELRKELKISPTEFKQCVRDLLTNTNSDNTKFSSFESVMEADLNQESIVDRLIMSGTLSMIAGSSGSGKSSLFTKLLKALHMGKSCLMYYQLKKLKLT